MKVRGDQDTILTKQMMRAYFEPVSMCGCGVFTHLRTHVNAIKL